jgi:hypothetical protein
MLFKREMSVLAIGYFAISIFLNIGASRLGHISVVSGDKDIFFPFSTMLFLFYPLLIYLPESHYKLTTFGSPAESTQNDNQ